MSSRSEKWDKRFMGLAEYLAQWSKDPSTKTGAVIVNSKNRIKSLGYNGFPQSIKDSLKRLKNRKIKYKIIIHCELNAINFAEGPIAGCRLYVWPLMPCTPCAAMIIQSGITEVIAPDTDNPRWAEDFKLTKELFEEAGVKLRLLK